MQVDPAEDLEVVVSACSHAGAVNVLQNARRLTGRALPDAFIQPSVGTVLRF